MKRTVLCSLLLAACASSTPSTKTAAGGATTAAATGGTGANSAATTTTTTPPPKPEPIAADAPKTTAAGHTFTAPAGWTLYSSGGTRVLEGPEKDIKVALVDVAHATDAADAVKQAWPTLDPKFARPLHIAQDQPARFGWQAAKRVRLRDLAERETQHHRLRAQEGRRLVRGAHRRRRRGDGAARQPDRPRGRQLASGRLHARVVRRQDGASARRRAPQAAHRFPAEGAAGGRRAGRRPRPHPSRQGRVRRRLRRARAWQAGQGRRRLALHHRLEHQGALDAAVGQRGRSRQVRLGHAGHAASIPTFKLGRRRRRPSTCS